MRTILSNPDSCRDALPEEADGGCNLIHVQLSALGEMAGDVSHDSS